MLWPGPLRHVFGEALHAPIRTADDILGDRLRAVVNEHTRAEADNSRCYEARVQSLIGDLFGRMGETRVSPDA